MKLKYILKNIEIMSTVGSTDIEISGIEYDSRNIKKGDLFVCIDGSKVDGHKFIESAKTKGAVAFLVEKNLAGTGNGNNHLIGDIKFNGTHSWQRQGGFHLGPGPENHAVADHEKNDQNKKETDQTHNRRECIR